MSESLFPEWVSAQIADAADPTEGYFHERFRQTELVRSLGQVVCEDGQHELALVLGFACPKCGAAL